MEDEIFKNLIWDKDSKWSGKFILANGKIAAFEIDGDDPGESITEAARNTLKFLIVNEALIRHKIAVSMRELYHQTWLYENTMTPEELAQSITLHSVLIRDEGGGELSYKPNDLGLFGGIGFKFRLMQMVKSANRTLRADSFIEEFFGTTTTVSNSFNRTRDELESHREPGWFQRPVRAVYLRRSTDEPVSQIFVAP